MRWPRPLLIALLPVALAGCLHRADRPGSLDVAPLLSPEPPPDAALVGYVLIERTAGGEEINRRVWDRIDEQVFPFEMQAILEAAGLRVGVAGESALGVLRRLIDDPRTDRGHRARLFALDRPAPLAVSDVWPRAEFAVPAATGPAARFARDVVALGFDLTVKDAADGKVLVRFVPHARFRDPNPFLPGADGIRDEAVEAFPGAAFELPLSPGEFVVIGTDWYWDGTFGHLAFTGEKDDRTVQRLLVLWAGRTRDEADGVSPAGSAPPLAVQAATARGSRP